MYRIVLIHPSAGVNWSGGTENFAIELSHYLSSYFEVELLGGSSRCPNYYPAGGIPRTYARDLVNLPIIKPLLASISTHPDIVVEHLTSFLPCTLRLLGKPADLVFPCNDYGGLAVAALVRHFIGTPILFKAATGLTGQGKALNRCLRFKPDRIVVFSQTMKDFVSDRLTSEATRIIPNGVDVKLFSPEGASYDFGLNHPLVLCVASLNRRDHKRVELAIRAIAKLPDASLLVCGDGPDRDYFQSLGDELLGERRFAIKTFPFKEMPAVYRSADLFTLPSLDEPFGQAYIQAMACGLATVATDDEMRRNIVGNAGILCDVTDLDAYSKAIASALSQDWRDRTQANVVRFSWDTIAKQYRDLILQTIEESKPKYRSSESTKASIV
ncbi:MAG: glycosyltransferase [Pleurocapsa sp.]